MIKKKFIYNFFFPKKVCWSWPISDIGSLNLGPYGPTLTDLSLEIGPGRTIDYPWCSASTVWVWVMQFFLYCSLPFLPSIPDWRAFIAFFEVLLEILRTNQHGKPSYFVPSIPVEIAYDFFFSSLKLFLVYHLIFIIFPNFIHGYGLVVNNL